MEFFEKSLKLKYVLALVVALQIVNAGVIVSVAGDDAKRPDEVELTKYQRNYVDCPVEYLDPCTNLSKRSTEQVEFKRYWEDKLYLEAESNRTIVARLTPRGPEIISFQ